MPPAAAMFVATVTFPGYPTRIERPFESKRQPKHVSPPRPESKESVLTRQTRKFALAFQGAEPSIALRHRSESCAKIGISARV